MAARRPLLGCLCLLVTTVIWGAAFLAQKLGMDHVGPFAFTVYRNALAGFFLLAFVQRPRGRRPAPPAVFANLRYGFCSGLALFAAMMFQQLGIMHTSPGICAFLTTNYVLAVPVLGLLLGRRPKIHVWAGVLVALLGTYLICVEGGESGSMGKGELLTVASAVGFAVQILVVDWCVGRDDADLPLICCSQFFTGALLGLPFLLLPSERALLSVEHVRAGFWAIAFCGVLSSGVAYTLQNVGQRMVAAAPAAVIMSLESAFAALFGWVAFRLFPSTFPDGVIESRRLVGCALVFLAAVGTQVFELRGER